MSRIDALEKIGRLVLWLAISSVFVMVPIGLAGKEKADEELRKTAADAQAKLEAALEAQKEAAPIRLELASMGTFITGLNSDRAEGTVVFSNVSPQSGVVCVTGKAINQETGASTESLPSCHKVEAYASNVGITVHFAGGDYDAACGKGRCKLKLQDEPDAVHQPNTLASGTAAP